MVLLLIHGAARAQDGTGSELNNVVGANQTVEMGFGARHTGMGITFAGFHSDANAVANSPASMNDVDDFTFSTAHAEKFGETKYDNFALLIPFEAKSTLGLGISRFGVSEIELRPEQDGIPRTEPEALFSVADYLVIAGFSRRWGGLDVGINFNLLYRHLDQDGIGMRGDVMAQYTFGEWLRLGALAKGVVPSSVSWESGTREYENPNLQLGAAVRLPAPYFYGTLQVAYQTEDLIGDKAVSAQFLPGTDTDPNSEGTLVTGNLGMEFLFDFGLAMRFGVTELNYSGSAPLIKNAVNTFGVGYSWKKILGVDYSFSPHPDLLSLHRVALHFTPSFPKFNGRNFRPGPSRPSGQPGSRKGKDESPVSPRKEEAEEPSKAAQEPAPPQGGPAQGAPAEEMLDNEE